LKEFRCKADKSSEQKQQNLSKDSHQKREQRSTWSTNSR